MSQIVNMIFQVLFSLVEALFTGISDLIVAATPSKRNESFNADFLPANKLLSKVEKGFCLTGDKNISVKASFNNSIIFGNSGSGKSSRLLIPSILTMNTASLVIHDPSRELFNITAKAKSDAGYSVKVIDYTNPEKSQKYNPLERVKTISDIKKIAKILIHTSLGGSGNKDVFWNISAENVLVIFIRYILFHAEKNYQNLYNVAILIDAFSGTPQKVDKLFVATKDDELLSMYKALVATDSKMLASIVSTAKASLLIFTDTEIAAVTSADTIDFESFRKQKTVLYINNNVSDSKYYSIISSLFFEQFFQSILKTLPDQTDIPIFFLLDESSSLFLPIMGTAISNCRKYNCGICNVYQTQNQLLDLYGVQQGRNILANSYSRVYFPGQQLEVCRELEALSGKFEFMDNQNIRRTKSLLTMDEIRTLKETLILIGNYPIIKTKSMPYYEHPKLKQVVDLPVYEIEPQYSEEDLATINLNGNEQAKQEA